MFYTTLTLQKMFRDTSVVFWKKLLRARTNEFFQDLDEIQGRSSEKEQDRKLITFRIMSLSARIKSNRKFIVLV